MFVTGITACPTGIAHTYMAQEALQEECERRGFDCHIETQGSIGIENELTEEDLDASDMIILAVAIEIEEPERFEDRDIYYADVNKAISHPEQVIDEALAYYSLD